MRCRIQPHSTRRALFQGVTYIRDVRQSPRPFVVHVITIDLTTPGIGFLVTPGIPGQERPLRARKTTEFLSEFGAQVAINADFFYPWYSHNPLSYYPHVGDPVTVEGFAASKGVVYKIYPKKDILFPTLFLSSDNHAQFGTYELPHPAIYNAISGDQMLLVNGVPKQNGPSYEAAKQPRTAIGLDRTNRKMILMVVDGRQPNYSEGVTTVELADLMRQYGAYNAMNLDGGGSSTLVVADKQRGPQILSCPIDCHIPTRERPVANHLGIFARPLP